MKYRLLFAGAACLAASLGSGPQPGAAPGEIAAPAGARADLHEIHNTLAAGFADLADIRTGVERELKSSGVRLPEGVQARWDGFSARVSKANATLSAYRTGRESAKNNGPVPDFDDPLDRTKDRAGLTPEAVDHEFNALHPKLSAEHAALKGELASMIVALARR